MKPSDHQEAIYSLVKKTNTSILVIAVAGSGKSTTMVNCIPLINPDSSIMFLAFNRHIVNELKARIPTHVKASTFNSLGHRALMQNFGRINLNSKKTRKIISELLVDFEAREYGQQIEKLISLCKSYCISPAGYIGMDDSDKNLIWLINRFSIDIGDEKLGDFLEITKTVLLEGIKLISTIDYDDQIYLPVILDLPVQTYDVLFVDECQDVSAAKVALLNMTVSPRGRVIAVGDKRQAINGFAGSDERSMGKIKTLFRCEELPLSTTYRCAKNIVYYANKFVKEIKPFEGAKDGEVSCWNTYKASDFKPTDMIMCRNSAPLISFAFSCIARNLAVRVLGREIGRNLIALIDMLKPTGIFGHGGLSEKLDEWQDKEVEKYLMRGDDEKVDLINDKVNSIFIFIDSNGINSVEHVKHSILSLFEDKENCMTLSTVHKSKGLEAPRAFILEPELMPSKYATKDWSIRQEENLQYVAITRAKDSLVFIRACDYEVMKC